MNNKEMKKYYVERDVSWMYFNQRILLEAQKHTIPLLERLTFLGIYSNNLDEFFRVRVATLNRILEYSDKNEKRLRDSAQQTLKQINKLNSHFSKQFETTVREVTEALKQEHIVLVNEKELNDAQRLFIRDSYYQNRLCGHITPIWMDAIKQFGEQADDTIYLAVRLTQWEEHKKSPKRNYAVIELPVDELGRFVQLPDHEGNSYLMYLDDVVRSCLPYIFKGMEYNQFEAFSFKFTKDAEMEIDTDLRNGLMQKISKGVKSRKRGEPIRVLYDSLMPKDLLKRLMQKLNVDKLDTILPSGRYHNHKDFMKFPDCGRSDLRYPKWPSIHKREFQEESMLTLIRQCDRFIHVPYHSFDAYIQLLREAAISKEVKSIKTTLYRLAKDSQVIKALIGAAQNGKKVTVVIELLARFDEASNINWSKKMQDAGIHVIFGVEGLKIHSKITHISTRNGDVACISTGNFHEGNARMYTDYLLMTARRPIVKEVDQVFNFIEKPYLPVRFKELLVSPNEMKKKLIQLIDNEIKNQNKGKPAYILGKINHITDEEIVEKLYEASACGVNVDMLVRGNCSLVTGVPGVSDTIHLTGIIDRYLEHSRILIFANGGEEKYYIGSADWMPRNLDHRIEVLTPVYDPDIQADLRRVVAYGLKDTRQGRIVDGSGENRPLPLTEGEPSFRSQEALYQAYLTQETTSEQ